jgi:hypothetical protein
MQTELFYSHEMNICVKDIVVIALSYPLHAVISE